jgi:mitochondrial fission protein ELM1
VVGVYEYGGFQNSSSHGRFVGYFTAAAKFHKRLALAILLGESGGYSWGSVKCCCDINFWGARLPESTHKVWCLLGKKAGDNTQVTALANALGYAFEEKHIVARPWELLTHLSLKVTLAGIDTSASSDLTAPWPDLVISAGRRNEPVARWIARQSGGRSKLVHIGRPWAPLAIWDFIVTTPQYFLPEQDNILHNNLPLHRVTGAQAGQAAEDWGDRFADLPRPWIAVLVGGDSGRFVMTPEKGAKLGEMASELARQSGGSILATDSPRTPRAAGDAFQSSLSAPHLIHRFGGGTDNPYQGLLALADAFVVTGESMSMLGEAVDTSRPLYVFDPGDGDVPWWRLPHAYRYKPLSHRLAMWLGPKRMRRDIGNIQSALVGSGRAQWLQPAIINVAAQTLVESVGSARSGDLRESESPAQQELERTATAVRQLLIAR